jgi:hypothetical protein
MRGGTGCRKKGASAALVAACVGWGLAKKAKLARRRPPLHKLSTCGNGKVLLLIFLWVSCHPAMASTSFYLPEVYQAKNGLQKSARCKPPAACRFCKSQSFPGQGALESAAQANATCKQVCIL